VNAAAAAPSSASSACLCRVEAMAVQQGSAVRSAAVRISDANGRTGTAATATSLKEGGAAAGSTTAAGKSRAKQAVPYALTTKW
jgi:hypothetical protein